MKKGLLILLSCLVFFSCYPCSGDIIDEAIIITLYEETRDTIGYEKDIDIHDTKDYWQSSTETETLGTGDCEDYVIAFMKKLHDIGIDSRLGLVSYVRVGKSGTHAIAIVYGVFYDPTKGYYGTLEEVCDWAISYNYLYSLSYNFVMAIATKLGTRSLDTIDIIIE